MERERLKPVKGSTNVKAVGWEPFTERGGEKGALTVEFKDGSLYVYKGVPDMVWIDFLSTASKGRFLHSKIAPFYQTFKVEECPHCGKGVERETR